MKKLTLFLLLWIFFVAYCLAYGERIYTNEQVCNAIYIIEGKEKARQPYGIETIECVTKDRCEQICLNTVRNNKKRYTDYGYLKYNTTLEFLASRYCPYNQKEWLRMLNSYLEKESL